MSPSDLAKLIERKDELETLLGRFEVWLLVFGILVVVGVAGESLFGIRTWWNNRKLQEVNRQIDQYRQAETAQVTQRAGEALERAAKAEQNLAGANERAALAEQHAAEANKTAEGFQLDIAKAQQAAAEANRTAEQERLARVRIEEKLAPRVLTAEQQGRLTQTLRPLGGRAVDVFVYGETPEIVSITTTLVALMNSAGLKAQFWVVTGGGAVAGILVLTRSGSDLDTQNAAHTIVSALNSAGLSAGPWQPFTEKDTPGLLSGPPWSNDKMSAVRMLIGTKP